MSTEAEQLKEMRAKRAAIEARRAEREAERSIGEQLEQERLALAAAEAIEAAEAEYGPVGVKIAVIDTPLGSIIVKRANRVLFKRYQDKGDTSTDDLEKLVRPCRVYPTAEELDRILEEKPGTLMRIANAVCELAGVRTEETKGKS